MHGSIVTQIFAVRPSCKVCRSSLELGVLLRDGALGVAVAVVGRAEAPLGRRGALHLAGDGEAVADPHLLVSRLPLAKRGDGMPGARRDGAACQENINDKRVYRES